MWFGMRSAEPASRSTGTRACGSTGHSPVWLPIEGRSAEALTQIRRAMALLEVTDNTLQLARGYLLSAGIESQEGRLEETREQLEIAERLLGTAPDPGDLGMLRIGQSRLASLDGDGDAAVERARDALAILGDLTWDRARPGVLGTRDEASRSRAMSALRSTPTAARSISLTVHGRRYNAGLASLDWANLLKQQGREDEAEPILRRAYDLGVTAETASSTS